MKPNNELKVGKHEIGWMSDSFKELIKDEAVGERATPTFQVLLRDMTDEEIEDELKPGLCTTSDLLAFFKNPPGSSKDGYWNLFYFSSCVVGVYWDAELGVWRVSTWTRGVNGWSHGPRVFAPGNGRSETKDVTLGDSDSGTLPEILEINGVKYKRV